MNESKLKGVESANVLQKEEMRLITGGKEEPKFHCTCTGKDGITVAKDVSSIQECWNLC